MNHPISGPKNGTPGRWHAPNATSGKQRPMLAKRLQIPIEFESTKAGLGGGSRSPNGPVIKSERKPNRSCESAAASRLDDHRLVYGESNWSRRANEIETEIRIRKLAGVITTFCEWKSLHTPSPQMAWQQQVNDTIIKWLHQPNTFC